MDIDELSTRAARAATQAVVRSCGEAIQRLEPDTSAVAPEHVVGFEAGFRACQKAILAELSE